MLVSKDSDFLDRVTRLGPPPQLLYVTCGNTSTCFLKEVFVWVFPEARQLLREGEAR